MITAREAASGLYGAWRLAHGDRMGLGYFDASLDGFWRSFWAAAIVAPAYLLLIGLSQGEAGGTAGPMRAFTVHAIAYALDWTAFPLAMVFGTRALGREANYLRFIVALNWAKVIEAAILLPAALLAAVVPGGLAGALPLLGFGLVLVYHWWVTKCGLGADGMEAAGIVGVNLAIGVAITVWAQSLLT
jgi:hypothetical protein